MSHLDRVSPKQPPQGHLQLSLFDNMPLSAADPTEKLPTKPLAAKQAAKAVVEPSIGPDGLADTPIKPPGFRLDEALPQNSLIQIRVPSQLQTKTEVAVTTVGSTGTLAELLAFIQADRSLSKRKAGDMASALRTVGKVLGKDLRLLPSDAGELRAPAFCRISGTCRGHS